MPVGHWIKAPWIDCEAHGGQKSFAFWVLSFGFCVAAAHRDVSPKIHSKPKTQNPKRKTQKRFPLLPFDSTRWLTGYIVADSVDAFYLIDDSRGDTRQDFVGNPDPVGRHPVLALHDTQSN